MFPNDENVIEFFDGYEFSLTKDKYVENLFIVDINKTCFFCKEKLFQNLKTISQGKFFCSSFCMMDYVASEVNNSELHSSNLVRAIEKLKKNNNSQNIQLTKNKIIVKKNNQD